MHEEPVRDALMLATSTSASILQYCFTQNVSQKLFSAMSWSVAACGSTCQGRAMVVQCQPPCELLGMSVTWLYFVKCSSECN